MIDNHQYLLELENYLVEGVLATPPLTPLISKIEQLPWSLEPEELRYFEHEHHNMLPFLVSKHYLSLATAAVHDPIRRQIIPRFEEHTVNLYELRDPLGEEKYQPSPRLIHRYPSRALLLVNDNCSTYCRHCFRRYFSGSDVGSISSGQLRLAIHYLKKNPTIKELLLSGGDPLMLSNQRLYFILKEIRSHLPSLVLRLATRMPVVMPERFDQATVCLLRSMAPLWVVTHFNHPQEIAPLTREKIALLIDSGLPLLNQCVLLRGVNDELSVLKTLMEELVQLRVKPYYLFQGDLARGTAHLRVSLERGLALVKELRQEVSGLAMPQYAVDLPAGGGKVPLTENYIEQCNGTNWVIRAMDGRLFNYPCE